MRYGGYSNGCGVTGSVRPGGLKFAARWGALGCALVVVGALGARAFAQSSSLPGPKMKALPPGETKEYWYEISMGPGKPLGYARITLTSKATSGGIRYEYAHETAARFPKGDRMEAKMTATLRTDFQPERIVLERKQTQITPDLQLGGKAHIVDTVDLTGDKVKVTSDINGVVESRTEEKPDVPVVYGMEVFADFVDPKGPSPFRIYELNPQHITAVPLDCRFEVDRQGTLALVTVHPEDNQASYQFWFKDDGSLWRWGEASMPMLLIRSTEDRMNPVKKWALTPWEEGEPVDPALKKKLLENAPG